MATPVTVHGQRLLELVSQGPLPYDYVVTEAAAAVHPGQAYRHASNKAEHDRKKRGGGDARVYNDAVGHLQKRIAYGARQIAMRSLVSFEQSGRVEVYVQDGVRMVRCGPRFDGVEAFRPQAHPYTYEVMRIVGEADITFDDLFDRVAPLIPEDEARVMREATRIRFRRKNKSVATHPVSDEKIVQIGKREILNRCVRSLVRSDRLTVTGTRGSRVVSRGPKWVSPDAASA